MADNEELERRVRVLEVQIKSMLSLVPVKAAGVGIGMVSLSGSEDLVSAGFVKVTVGGTAAYMPYFRKVE